MTEIERKALVERLGQVKNNQLLCIQAIAMINHQARAIEQHEAFRQEVSDAVADAMDDWPVALPLQLFIALENMKRFIITKPDPLVEVCREIGLAPYRPEQIRAAIEKRGDKIVWGEG